MAERPVTPVNQIVLLTGNAHPQLAAGVANLLKVTLCKRVVENFRDGECRVITEDDVRGKDVFILQPTGQPDRNQTEIELIVGSIRSSAWRIIPVITYVGYARSDWRDRARVPISLVSRLRNLLQTGIDGVVFFEAHTLSIVSIAEALNPRIMPDHLFARPILLEWLLKQDLSNVTIASTDAGGGKRVESLCKRLWDMGYHVEFGMGYKVGSSSSGVRDINLLGKYQGRHTIFIDDMAASGETANRASAAAKALKADKVTFIALHPVLADLEACQNIANGPIDEFLTTNSLPINDEAKAVLGEKHQILSIDALLAKAIRNLHECRSMSALFELEGYQQASMDS